MFFSYTPWPPTSSLPLPPLLSPYLPTTSSFPSAFPTHNLMFLKKNFHSFFFVSSFNFLFYVTLFEVFVAFLFFFSFLFAYFSFWLCLCLRFLWPFCSSFGFVSSFFLYVFWIIYLSILFFVGFLFSLFLGF
jgi:hypothetical protein